MPASLNGDKIAITFMYSEELVNLVKTLPDRSWNKADRSWEVPADPWHAMKVCEILEDHIAVGDDVVSLSKSSDQANTTPKRKLNPNLYPFQEAAVEFAVRNKAKALLSDEMGLGKTVQAIEVLRRLRPRKTLIVAPASVLYKWKLEIEKWIPMYPVDVLPSTKAPIEKEIKIHICSYDIMVRKYDDLRLMSWDMIIFDECHRLKNYKAKRTRVAKSLSNKVPHVLGLTGTPVLNKPAELFSILNIIDPNKFPNWYTFGKRYCFTEELGYGGATNLEELSERLQSIMVRRLKTDVLDQLPDLTRTIVPIQIDLEEYNQVINSPRNPDAPRISGSLDKITKAHIIIGKEKAKVVIDFVENMMEEGLGKIVLYVVHREVADLLAFGLRKYAPLKIVGDTQAKDRQAIVQRWQNTDNNRVMIISRAGGEGIDLFGINRDISTILFVEREWNPASEEQAEARLHRIGQKNSVEAIYFVALGTLDTNVNALIESKRQMVGDIIATKPIDVRYDLLDLVKE